MRRQDRLVQNPLLFGIIGALVALAMLVTELLGHRLFTLQLTPTCGVPLWTLFGTYAALQLIVWRYSNRPVDLTNAELARWGAKLEAATPDILTMYGEEHKSVRDIATSLESNHGIPKHITLRYIVALGRHLRDQRSSDPVDPSAQLPSTPRHESPDQANGPVGRDS
jgi:hypothetical protein